MTNRLYLRGTLDEVDYCARAIRALCTIQKRDAETINALVFATVIKEKGFLSKHKNPENPYEPSMILKPFYVRTLDAKIATSIDRVLNIIKAANNYKRQIEAAYHAYRYYVRMPVSMNYKEAIEILGSIERFVNVNELLDDVLKEGDKKE